MTKVDFYILADNTIEQRHLFACRLVEKAFKLDHQIYIHTDDNAQANAIDQLLWNWRSTSFVPHQLETSASDGDDNSPYSAARVQIGFGGSDHSATRHNGLMINLAQQVPDFFSRFDRLSEIVVQAPAVIESTRSSFRFYRDRGYQLQTHDLRK